MHSVRLPCHNRPTHQPVQRLALGRVERHVRRDDDERLLQLAWQARAGADVQRARGVSVWLMELCGVAKRVRAWEVRQQRRRL